MKKFFLTPNLFVRSIIPALLAKVALSNNFCFAQDTGTRFTSFAGFNLGKGALATVQEKLGTAKVVHTGDAGDYMAEICYRTDSGLISFLSGEMGGSDLELLGFGISEGDAGKPCPPMPVELIPAPFELSGLCLKMTKADFELVVATNVKWDGDVGRAFYESKRPMTDVEIGKQSKDVQEMIKNGQMQNYFDVDISVEGKFTDGQLISFRIWKIETL
jgi:hypothetical protein